MGKENPSLSCLFRQQGQGKNTQMQTRIATILLLISPGADTMYLNGILAGFAPLIMARNGYNLNDNELKIITLLVKGTNDEIGALSGRLGKINGIRVKTASLTINQIQ